MPFISVTRLRIRSVRFLPAFVVDVLLTRRQVRKAQGFQDGSLLADRAWTFWTMTAWDSPDSMRRYMTTGRHKAAMPSLLHWCDEASVMHWDRSETSLPSWSEADARMRAGGRPSKVRHPSQAHADMSFRAPRMTGGARIGPAPRR